MEKKFIEDSLNLIKNYFEYHNNDNITEEELYWIDHVLGDKIKDINSAKSRCIHRYSIRNKKN